MAAAPVVQTSRAVVGVPPEVSTPSFAQMVAAGAAAVAVVSARELGDLFGYCPKDRVTLQKNQSALMPIV